jgi:protein-tyrosine phosphatase
MRRTGHFIAAAMIGLMLPMAAAAAITGARVDRQGDALNISWKGPNPVDVYEADTASAPVTSARSLAKGETDGAYTRDHAGAARRYFVLVDRKDHQTLTVAERLLPLAQASNFRDIGGYDAAGGKHVRWGLIYRSGGQPLLTAEDQAQIKALGLTELVDLRSSEERVMAPTRIMGVPYTAVGYSMSDLMPKGAAAMRNGSDVYRNMPTLLAPQLRLIFAHLLNKPEPIAYNCSAGQDRAGFTTAIILSALGVPRDQIIADYHLSTVYRRPEFEMPRLENVPADNSVAQMFAAAQNDPRARIAQPLKDADGKPFLDGAFAEIDARWGSIDGYLTKELRLTRADIDRLRRLYLE